MLVSTILFFYLDLGFDVVEKRIKETNYSDGMPGEPEKISHS